MIQDNDRTESSIRVETTPAQASHVIQCDIRDEPIPAETIPVETIPVEPNSVEPIPAETIPVDSTMIVSKMKQMLENNKKMSGDISNVLEQIQLGSRLSSQTSKVQEFTEFFSSRMVTLNENQQRIFIDKMLQTYIQIKNLN